MNLQRNRKGDKNDNPKLSDQGGHRGGIHGHNVAVYFITKRKIASDGHQYVNASGRANARPNNSNNTVPKCQSLPGGSTGMFIVPRWGIVVKFIQNRKHLETCQLEAEQVMAGILTF